MKTKKRANYQTTYRMYNLNNKSEYDRISTIRDWIIEHRQYILDIADELNSTIIKNDDNGVHPLFTEDFQDQYCKKVFDKLASLAVTSLGCSMEEVHSTLEDHVTYKDFVMGMLSVVEKERNLEEKRQYANNIRAIKRGK